MVPDGLAEGLRGDRARLHGGCWKRVGVVQSGIGVAAMSASGWLHSFERADVYPVAEAAAVYRG